MAQFDGIRYVLRPDNGGFMEAVQSGITAARGEIVAMVNNDVFVAPGWARAIHAAFADPSVGIAGSRLTFPDGLLQEFGTFVWRDGTPGLWGWRQDPGAPAFAHDRTTPLVTGAALAIRRQLFEDLGGFDPRYAPSYYEDTDLCMRARARGWRIVAAAAARAVHHMAATADIDPRKSRTSHYERNRLRFRERWAEVLDRECWPRHPVFECAAAGETQRTPRSAGLVAAVHETEQRSAALMQQVFPAVRARAPQAWFALAGVGSERFGGAGPLPSWEPLARAASVAVASPGSPFAAEARQRGAVVLDPDAMRRDALASAIAALLAAV